MKSVQIQSFLTACSCHVMYTFQSESTLYSCLNVKELLAQSRREIWNLSDCNWTRTYDHLIHKLTLNHLAKLAKWLSVHLWTKWLWVRVQLQSQSFFWSIFSCIRAEHRDLLHKSQSKFREIQTTKNSLSRHLSHSVCYVISNHKWCVIIYITSKICGF